MIQIETGRKSAELGLIEGKERLKPATTALIFPGQGSQFVGMDADLYARSAAARGIFDQASNFFGINIRELCSIGPDPRLQRTEFAQPAIFTVSIAALEALKEIWGGDISGFGAVAGHSLGEYAALVAAGAIDFKEALKLVKERSILMKKAGEINGGGMAAVQYLSVDALEKICQSTKVEIAVDNYEGNLVISGENSRLDLAIERAKLEGGRCIPLGVSGAFHSRLMLPPAEKLRKVLESTSFRTPKIPIFSNITVQPLMSVEEIKSELWQQMIKKVRWREIVLAMSERGVDAFIEIGPGKVLSNLVRKIVNNAKIFPVGSHASLKSLPLPVVS